jgi:hypothetical protein
LKLTGALPAVFLIVLGAAAILFAVYKPLSFQYKQRDGTEMSGTGGPESGLRYLPAVLDTLVRGDSASPRGMTLESDSGGLYYPVDLLGRAWAVEKACERGLEASAAEPIGLVPEGETVRRYLPPILDSLARGRSASPTGAWVVASRSRQTDELRNAERVLAACGRIVTTDRSGNPVLLGDRVRTEGPQ